MYVGVGVNTKGKQGAVSPARGRPASPRRRRPSSPTITLRREGDHRRVGAARQRRQPATPAKRARACRCSRSRARSGRRVAGARLQRVRHHKPATLLTRDAGGRDRASPTRRIDVGRGRAATVCAPSRPSTGCPSRAKRARRDASRSSDTFPPAAPKDLQAVATEGAISLIWDANTENGSRRLHRAARPRARRRARRDHAAPIRETTFQRSRSSRACVRVRGAGGRQGRQRQPVRSQGDASRKTARLSSIRMLRIRGASPMKLFVDTGSIKEIETHRRARHPRRRDDQPSLLAKEPGDFRQNLKKICDIVKGPVSGEVTATDFAGHDARRPRHREDRPAHGRQGAADARRASRPARRCRAKASAST